MPVSGGRYHWDRRHYILHFVNIYNQNIKSIKSLTHRNQGVQFFAKQGFLVSNCSLRPSPRCRQRFCNHRRLGLQKRSGQLWWSSSRSKWSRRRCGTMYPKVHIGRRFGKGIRLWRRLYRRRFSNWGGGCAHLGQLNLIE